MRDKITALAAPPGNSLTEPPGKWPWERPPQFPDPDDAIDHFVESVSHGPAREDMLKMMMAGITVEEIVNQVAFKGFMAGAFTPDVAELIKPAVAVFLINMALESGFEPQMFIDDSPAEGAVSDQTFFEIMKSRNPAGFSAMVEELNKMERMKGELDRQDIEKGMMAQQQEYLNENQESFLRTEEE